LLGELRTRGGTATQRPIFSVANARDLKERSFDLEAMRQQGYAYERLDQLTMEILLGVR
jgi:xylose isomerase